MKNWFSKNRTFLLRMFGTLLAAGSIVVLIERESWQEIAESLKGISLSVFFLAIGSLLISRVFVILRWHVLLRSAGVGISLFQSAQLTMTGLFASNYLPTTIGGDVVRLAGAMKLGFDRAICLASIAVDRIVGMAGMFCAVPFGLIPAWNALDVATYQFYAASLLFTKVAEFTQRIMRSFTIWLQKPGALFASLFYTFGNMVFIFTTIFILLRGLGEHVSFWLIAGIWGLSYFVTLIPISINGYGVQELSLTFLFSRVAGIAPVSSLAVAVLIRVVFLIASLPGALFLPSVLAAVSIKDSNEPKLPPKSSG